jgi:DNA-binding beta-propeller fold protein YncE
MRASWFVLVLAACGGDLAVSPGATGDGGIGMGCLSSSECPTGQVCNDFGRCEAATPPGDGGTEPEEIEYEFGEPTASQRYVYVAMTAQDELARIDGTTLAVKAVPVGESPRVIAAIPGTDGAISLDSVNGTVTIVRPAGETDSRKVLATLPNLNRLDVDPTGRYAVIWFDLQKQIAEGGISGIGSFQDVTVLNLTPGAERAVNLTVGFRPRDVQFDAAGTRGYVITQDGVSVVDLGYSTTHPPSIVPPIPVADPLLPPANIEVGIVATGQYAAVRFVGEAKLRVVDVAGPDPGHIYDIPLAAPPTDLDLSPDGTRVYVVQRETSSMSIVDVPGDALAPAGVETIAVGAPMGSLVLSRDGGRALLYTNASLDEKLAMVKLDDPAYPRSLWPLKKAVRAIGLSPTGTSAIVIHAKAPGDPANAGNVDEFIDRSYGYSLVDMATGFAKLQVTTVDPGPFAYSPDGAKAYVSLDGGDMPTAARALQIVTVQTGVVTTSQLGSPPSTVGVLPVAGEAFVAQRHPLGRVTFVRMATDGLRTVTGFDLNSDIVQ